MDVEAQSPNTMTIALKVLKVEELPSKSGIGLDTWVTYQTTSAAGQGTITDRYIDLITVNDVDDPDAIGHQMLKARAEAIISGVRQQSRGGNSVMPDGHMALKEWGALSNPIIAAFEHAGIISVQMLRDAPHGKLATLSIGVDPLVLQQKARAFLVALQDSSVEDRLVKQQQETSAMFSELKRENDQLRELLERALDRLASDAPNADVAPAPRRGRPPKVASESEADRVDMDVAA